MINGRFSDQGFLTGFAGVSPTPPALPSEGVFHGESQVAGDTMTGDVTYTLWGNPNPDGSFSFRTLEVFSGFVAGCGIGTMTFTAEGTATPTSDPGRNDLHATWTFVPESGTEGLRGMTGGGGELDGETGPTATSPDPTANSGVISGTLRCIGNPND